MAKNIDKTIQEQSVRLRQQINADAQAAMPAAFALASAAKKIDNAEVKAEAFHVVGICFDVNRHFERSLVWYNQALEQWIMCRNKLGEAKTRNNIGRVCYETSRFKEAIPFLREAIELKSELKEYKSLAATYQNLGSVYERLSEYKRAMEVYYKALKISEKLGDVIRTAEINQNIGNIYHARENYRQAIEFFQKALKIQAKSEDKLKLIHLDNNMGTALLRLKQYKEALHYFELSQSMAESIHHIPLIAYAQNNKGITLKLMGRLDEALQASQKGLELSITEADIYSQCNALTNIGEVHLLNKNYAEAQIYLKRALDACRKAGAKTNEAEIYLLLSKLHEAAQNTNMALYYYKQYDKVKSNVANTEIANRINQLQTQYEVGKKEEELLKTRSLQIESELKALRAQMDPHFIFNSLNSLRKELLEGNIEKADKYIVRFSRLLRLILDTTRSPQVKLSDNIELLHLYIQIEQSRHPDSFTYDIKVAPGIKPENISVPGMILQPLVENAIVHGLFNKQGSAGRLLVRFSKTGNVLKIKVTDNGVGRKRSSDTRAAGHLSHATSIIQETLALAWKEKMKDRFFSIKDRVQANGEPAGTEVTVLLPFVHT